MSEAGGSCQSGHFFHGKVRPMKKINANFCSLIGSGLNDLQCPIHFAIITKYLRREM